MPKVTFNFPDDVLKELFLAYMSDGGGDYQFISFIDETEGIVLDFKYRDDTVVVSVIEEDYEEESEEE
jgi:hypothetical protein